MPSITVSSSWEVSFFSMTCKRKWCENSYAFHFSENHQTWRSKTTFTFTLHHFSWEDKTHLLRKEENKRQHPVSVTKIVIIDSITDSNCSLQTVWDFGDKSTSLFFFRCICYHFSFPSQDKETSTETTLQSISYLRFSSVRLVQLKRTLRREKEWQINVDESVKTKLET